MMRISIAMCTYNGARFVSEQLQSIATQTRVPDELIVCDDGSRDDTISIIERFAASVPFPVRIFANEQNLGSTGNFEKAISLCSGELIALCDQDDIWMENKLEYLEPCFADSSIGGVFSDASLVDEDSQPSDGTLWRVFGFTPRLRDQWRTQSALPVLMKQDIVTGATLMFRAELRSSILPISREWIHDGWIAWMIAMTSQLDFLDAPLIRYRVHRSQQAGIPDSSSTAIYARLVSGESGRSLRDLRKFEDLYFRIDRLPIAPSSAAIGLLQQKIMHCHFRVSLPANRAARVPAVLSHLPDYSHYSRGLREAMKDMVQP
jgi:glycosyltransferase involved in cell wall biosynthesis